MAVSETIHDELDELRQRLDELRGFL